MTSSPITKKVDELFSEWNKPDSPGFAIAIIKSGEIIYKQGYGTADLEHNIPITPGSVFDIGSTSKQFTAMCIVLLARQGKLSLDDEIQKYISEMPRYEHPITIRQLIHHTSGIRDYLTLMELAGMRFENEYPDDEVIGMIARQKGLNFKPGDEFLYCNSGYLLLAEIVKRVSGKPLSAFANENIFAPLGMKNTHFHDDFTMIVKDRAVGYSPKSEGGFQIDMSIFDVVGDGCVYTTVEDLFLWDENFYRNKLGGHGQALIEEITTPGTLNSGEALDYAFGLITGQYRGLKTISHGGAWMGYRAEMLRFPEHFFTVICLSNLGSTNPTGMAKKIADVCLTDEFTAQENESTQSEAQFIEIPPAELEGKAGVYLCSKSGIMLELLISEGKLLIKVFGMSISIVPVNSNSFKAVDVPFDLDIQFKGPGPDGLFQMSVVEDGKPDIYQQLNVDSPDPGQLKDFAGEYHCEELDVTYKITTEGGRLLLDRRNSAQDILKPTIKDLLKGTRTTLQFIRDEHDKITGFDLGAGRVKNIRFTK